MDKLLSTVSAGALAAGLLVSLHRALPEGVPDWIELAPAGEFSGRDGRGPFKNDDPDAVIAASMADGPLPIDENHAIDFAMQTGQPSPARGRIVAMENRNGAIWGRAEWNATGEMLLKEKSYTGISPVLAITKTGARVVKILRAALTNTPNLPQLATLHHQQEPTMDLIKLRAALGLPETADEGAILTAATAATGAAATHATTLTAIATAAGLTAVKPEAMVAELQTMRATMVTPATVTQLQTELAQLKASGAKDKAVTYVDGAIKAGKPINAMRDQYVAMHTADPVGTEKLINALPSIHTPLGGGAPRIELNAEGGADDGLTAEDRQTCQKMGLDPVKFAAQKKKRMAADGGSA